MDLSKIVSITGMPGLYKIISKSQNSLIVESLTDKKRFPVFASHQTTTLEDISVFTTDKDLPLKDVLKKIYEMENKGPAIDSKADEKLLKEYFEKALPDYDKERVYPSHIKKMIAWYNLLQSLNLLEPTEEELKAEAEAKEKEVAEEKKEPEAETEKKEEVAETKAPAKKSVKKTEPKEKKEVKTEVKKPKKTKE